MADLASSAPVAAVDCGTNSTRLLVAAADGTALERLMTITRLGQGVDDTHRLDGEAIGRTVRVLRRYREAMDARGVDRVRVTATSAARDAANRDEFFIAAADAVGVTPELLAGEEEARLSFAGATAELDPADGPWLVADIGGGSTELAAGGGEGGGTPPGGGEGGGDVGDRLRPTAVRSLDVGCVRITERFLRHDPPEPGELDAARAMVAEALAAAVDEQPALAEPTTMVGLAGTVAAAAALDLRLETYDRAALHHHQLRADVVAGLLEELAALDTPGRRDRPGMEKERAGVIVGGLVVLDGLLRHFGMYECLASESDILDGLVMSLLAPPPPAA